MADTCDPAVSSRLVSVHAVGFSPVYGARRAAVLGPPLTAGCRAFHPWLCSPVDGASRHTGPEPQAPRAQAPPAKSPVNGAQSARTVPTDAPWAAPWTRCPGRPTHGAHAGHAAAAQPKMKRAAHAIYGTTSRRGSRPALGTRPRSVGRRKRSTHQPFVFLLLLVSNLLATTTALAAENRLRKRFQAEAPVAWRKLHELYMGGVRAEVRAVVERRPGSEKASRAVSQTVYDGNGPNFVCSRSPALL
jgi:hypothetical protein